ncbi:MAG: zinc ABC transporter substrate-binding protein [Lachnospiraceae bacterium]|nr:zinc ABC transporter substrate-binding protein [Lachnospiraceae bacterium]MDY5741943.1 zinc ABC transporter substrate-binding protein [Lachnospiraceae bacterium]
MRKRIITRLQLLAVLMLAALLAMACGKKSETGNKDTKMGSEKVKQSQEMAAKKKVLVTTSFLQDMVKQIAGDSVDIELMIPAGADPHLYEAKPEDYRKLKEADLVLYHGLHFEGKMVEALEAKGVSVSKNFPEDKLGKMDEDGEIIVDPHFWFDLKLYAMAVDEAAKALSELLPANKADYEKARAAYVKELEALDEENRQKISAIPKESRYLITPHDAFNYFSRSYDIEVKAPQGVSTESETSNQDIRQTIDFIVEHKVKAVFAESTTDPNRMEKLREGVMAKGHTVKVVKGEGQELFSDSLAPAGQKGDSFIEMYRHNVDLIVSNLK